MLFPCTVRLRKVNINARGNIKNRRDYYRSQSKLSVRQRSHAPAHTKSFEFSLCRQREREGGNGIDSCAGLDKSFEFSLCRQREGTK